MLVSWRVSFPFPFLNHMVNGSMSDSGQVARKMDDRVTILKAPSEGSIYIYVYGYWVKSGRHGTAFINCTCMFEGYIYLPSTHIYQRHS